MSKRTHNRRSAARTLAIPAALALVSLAGLIAGLLGEQAWDYLAWFGIGLPVVVIGAALVRS